MFTKTACMYIRMIQNHGYEKVQQLPFLLEIESLPQSLLLPNT